MRTTPILEAIKEKYPNSEITWITVPITKEILSGNPNINHLLTIPLEEDLGTFDILYSLDIEPEAGQTALKIKADKKYGFYDSDGFPMPFNPEAEYYINTVFDDDLKKSNRKTYQEMLFEFCDLEYKKQLPKIYLTEESKNNINNFLKENALEGKKIVGFNIGSAPRWPSKAWHTEKVKECIKKLKEKNYEVILFGGPEEIELNKKVASDLEEQGVKIYAKNTANSLKDFFALINSCDKIICGDTLVLPAAIALNKPITGLFFCTPPWEIESYNLVTKVVSPMLNTFFPERMDEYNEKLVKSVSVDEVLETMDSLLA